MIPWFGALQPLCGVPCSPGCFTRAAYSHAYGSCLQQLFIRCGNCTAIACLSVISSSTLHGAPVCSLDAHVVASLRSEPAFLSGTPGYVDISHPNRNDQIVLLAFLSAVLHLRQEGNSPAGLVLCKLSHTRSVPSRS